MVNSLFICQLVCLSVFQKCVFSSTEVLRPRGVPLSKKIFYDPRKEVFNCIDGSTSIPFVFVNDDYCDCPTDGSDEPGTSACSNGVFHCSNVGHYGRDIPSSRVNDGICDCCDASDEFNSSVSCPNNCMELGAKAREEAKLKEELLRKGAEVREQYKKDAVNRRTELSNSIAEKRQEMESLEAMRNEKEALKKTAEDQERAALDKRKVAEEAAKNAEQEAEMVKAAESDRRFAEEAFQMLDLDKDGMVTHEEFKKFPAVDKDRDGVVSDEEAKFYLHMKDAMNLEEWTNVGWMIYKPLYILEKQAQLKRAVERNEAIEKFKQLDLNNDGNLGFKELMNLPALDKNRDGSVSESEAKSFLNMKSDMKLDEWITAGWANYQPILHVERMQEYAKRNDKAMAEDAFKKLDVNGDGILTYTELMNYLPIDKDGDGTVSEMEAKYYLNMEDDMKLDEWVNNMWAMFKPIFVKEKVRAFKANKDNTPPPPTPLPVVEPVPEVISDTDTPDVESPELSGDHLNADDEVTYHDEANEEEDEELEGEGGEDEGEVEDTGPPLFPPKDELEKDESDIEGAYDTTDPVAPKTEVEYDPETQMAIDEAKRAREEFTNADTKYLDAKKEIREMESILETDFGLDAEFLPLQGQCFEFTNLEYTYKLCLFDKTTQSSRDGGGETNLGRWGRWTGPEPNRYSIMKYESGASCWNGPARSVEVHLSCGMENKLLSASEPSRCEYKFGFETPALCHPSLLPEQQQGAPHEHSEL